MSGAAPGRPSAAFSYWVADLRLTTLLGICRQAGRGRPPIRLVWLRAGPLAAARLRRLQRRPPPGLELHPIRPRATPGGPDLDLHAVRDDAGQLLIMRIYRRVLSLRRQALDRLLGDPGPWPFLQPPHTPDMWRACLGLKISEAINDDVFLASAARWRFQQPGRGGPERRILLAARGPFSALLAREVAGLVDEVRLQRRWLHGLRRWPAVARGLLRSLAGLWFPPRRRDFPGDPPRIMTTYVMGVDPSRRNDIGFMHRGGIDFSRLALYCRYDSVFPDTAEAEWLAARGVECFVLRPAGAVPPGTVGWRPSPGYRGERRTFERLFLKSAAVAVRRSGRGTAWLLEALWSICRETAYWTDFLAANRVAILVHTVPAPESFVPKLAVDEIGGLAVSIERSILFDYCTYIHNPPAHLSIVSGPYSCEQIPEPSFSRYTLQSGALQAGSDGGAIPGLAALRGPGRRVVALFDELPNNNFFGDSIRAFYDALLGLAEADPRFALLVKSKKPAVLQSLPTIGSRLDGLEKAGRALRADWKVPVQAAAVQSDIVACVPSTAAFECVLHNCRTLLFNPMRTGSSLFYRGSGLGRRVFEDGAALRDALRRWADGADDAVGRCDDLRPHLDPFADGLGSERAGRFLGGCLAEFGRGRRREELLAGAVAAYAAAWGKDKINCHPQTENHEP